MSAMRHTFWRDHAQCGKNIQATVLLMIFLASVVVPSSLVKGLSHHVTRPEGSRRVRVATCPANENSTSRRALLFSAAVTLLIPTIVNARFIMDDDTGEYVEVEERDWQIAWKERLDKAQSMTLDEVFMAARGAGNTNLKDGPESDVSKKRRAMAGCREPGLRKKANVPDEKECTARVLNGDFSFMLDIM